MTTSICELPGVTEKTTLTGTTAGVATTMLFSPAIVRAAASGTVFVESWGGSYAEAVKDYILEPFKAATGIDYKDIQTLQKLTTGQGKLFSRKRSGNCAKHQRQAKLALKRARYMGLMPYVGS